MNTSNIVVVEKQTVLVSVIIPVYNVAPFIERCAHSLFRQTLENVEFIFVDDASPDNSMELLEKCLEQYPARKSRTKLLHHPVNKGLPAARNTGLDVATGEYIFHCDSDDYLEPDALESMYREAKAQDADIVWTDWYLSFQKNERYMKQPDYPSPLEALKGMLSGSMKYNVWNKLVRRSIYTENGIRFPEGHNMGEDMTMMQLFACAQTVRYLPKAYYHYVRLNAHSFTQTSDSKAQEQHLEDLRYNVQRTISFIEKRYGQKLEREIAFFKLESKFPFLITTDRASFCRWTEWFPEANAYILQNKNVSFRSRLLQFMAAKGQFWYVRLYYMLLIRLVYGVIYK